MISLGEDILYAIFSEVVTSADSNDISRASKPCHPSHVLSSPSQVSRWWRSILQSAPALWARHIEIHSTVTSTWLQAVVRRTGSSGLRLYVSDFPLSSADTSPLQASLAEMLQRCVFLHFQSEGCVPSHTNIMTIVITTPAPVLQECVMDCQMPSRALKLWAPLFRQSAPHLKTFRLKGTCHSDNNDSRYKAISISALIFLSNMPHLVCLELSLPSQPNKSVYPTSFSTHRKSITFRSLQMLSLIGYPGVIADFVLRTNLPRIRSVSAVYEGPPASLQQAWGSLLERFGFEPQHSRSQGETLVTSSLTLLFVGGAWVLQ